MSSSSGMLNQIESVRSQLGLAACPSRRQFVHGRDVRAGGDSLARKLTSTEGNLIDLRLTGPGQDQARIAQDRRAAQLSGRRNCRVGLRAGEPAATGRPGAGQAGADTRTALQSLINNDLSRFNALLRSKGLKTIDASVPAVVF